MEEGQVVNGVGGWRSYQLGKFGAGTALVPCPLLLEEWGEDGGDHGAVQMWPEGCSCEDACRGGAAATREVSPSSSNTVAVIVAGFRQEVSS
ncbi:hypothetical protein CLOM_g18124 [Closterium sp. NIES-68]|nr:hypothetical protein CLOM_g18124 [Closterium sp. NIES-68]